MNKRLAKVVLSAAIAAATYSMLPATVYAQADASAAYQEGKKAFEAGQFDKARDLFAKAAQTDVKNPEVFLWLGKAAYQLGAVDAALDAWAKTQALAPEEPYSAQMLKALRGGAADVATSLTLIEALVDDEQHAPAVGIADKLLADKGLTDVQRARALTLRARALLGVGRVAEVEPAVRELLVRYPQQADPAQTSLLLAMARLRGPADRATDGVDLLKKVIADHANTPAAAMARFELIAFDLAQGVDQPRVDALAKWVLDNPKHALVSPARRKLVEVYLALAARSGAPTADAKLHPAEESALAVAAEVYKQTARSERSLELTKQIINHFDARYLKARAYGAGVAGINALLKSALPPSSRSLALRSSARYRTEMTVAQLAEQAAAGQAFAAPQPQALTDVVALLDAINNEFPADGAWREQAALAERVREVGAATPWPAKVVATKPPYAWATAIALPIVKARADAAAVEQAVKTVTSIVNDVLTVGQPTAQGLALEANGQLLAALAPDDANWQAVAWGQAGLLDQLAAAEFRQNLRDGTPEKNAKLSARQEELIATLAKIVAREAKAGQRAVETVRKHLGPWIEARQFQTAEDAYAKLSAVLPEDRRRVAQLEIVTLWVQRTTADHQRLTSVGLRVPEALDESLAKALKRLYELQDSLPDSDPFLSQVRATAENVVQHYKRLGYFATAEAAAQVKSDPTSPAADAYAQFLLARLRDEAARRELANVLKQYNAANGLKLTPATRLAIDAYQKFITDHPSDALIEGAANSVLVLIEVYEQNGAHDVAAAAYAEFAAFAGKTKVLSQAPAGMASFADRAVYQAAAALEAKARAALEKVTAKAVTDARGTPTPAPAKISPEFEAALSAYRQFLKDRPESPLVGQAIGQIMGIAMAYASANVWDVADGIYANLLGANDDPKPKAALAVRDPERIEFCRGMCQIGKVMPEHAKEVLAAITAGRPMKGIEAATALADATKKEAKDNLATGAGGGAVGAGGFADELPATPQAAAASADSTRPTPAGVATPSRPRSGPDVDESRAKADNETLAAITRQEARRANQVAALRDANRNYRGAVLDQPPGQKPGQPVLGNAPNFNLQNDTRKPAEMQQAAQQQAMEPQAIVPVLSEAELARQQSAIDAAYKIFIAIKAKSPETASAVQARAEIQVAIDHWRSIAQWQRAAALARQYLADSPSDPKLHLVRLGIALDELAYAGTPLPGTPTRQAMLTEIGKRFDAARKELAAIVADFPAERAIAQETQWKIANSYITQARVVDAASPTLARGQYVRATRELLRVAGDYADHPQIGTVPQILWDVASELSGRGYDEEAISVWKELATRFPNNALSGNAMFSIAQTYQNKLARPLRAAEVYLEINFIRGGADAGVQQAVFQIGEQLKGEKRWIEALHVLQMFVDALPQHANAGQALAMIGQVHQANEAWPEAIAAYQRVISDFPSAGAWVQEAKWAIADCNINLSQWRGSIAAYESFVAAFPKDPRVPDATRRIGILKDLANYQTLVDENGSKAFDAQFQMASIVQTQLGNASKAIEEFAKAAANYPKSHLADDALYQIGLTLLQRGDVEQARERLQAVAARYPDSPLADDSLYQIGKSFEDEAVRLAGLTRGTSFDNNREIAQNKAYNWALGNYKQQRAGQNDKLVEARKAGGKGKAEQQEASNSAFNGSFDRANVELAAEQATQQVESMTASQLADRQDKINAALRRAVVAYGQAGKVPGADKAGEALLRTAVIYNEKLHDSPAAMSTWLEIVRQFSGTNVAEEASWQIAQNYERSGKHAEAVEAYKGFLRNYRRSPKAPDAQFGIAENYEHLGQWIAAMDQYTNYVTNFPEGPSAGKAKEQISFIKTYRL